MAAPKHPRRQPRAQAQEVEVAAPDTVTVTAPTSSPNRFRDFQKFLKDVRIEIGRVVWPDRKMLQQSTAVVLLTLIFFSVYLGVLDKVFGWAFGLHR